MEGDWHVLEHILVEGVIVHSHVKKESLLVTQMVVTFNMVTDMLRM